MENKIRVDRARAAEIPLLAPLAAGFRVELKGYTGIVAEPDEAAAAEELREYLTAGWPVFGAWAEGRLCGYLVCRVEEPCVWVESLYVLPEYRRRGVATALFRRAEEVAASYGEPTLYNYVHPNNQGVIDFLRSRGYSVLNLIELRKACPGERLKAQINVGGNLFDYGTET